MIRKKHKKVAIVTIISRNYGNRLQNFALQQYLKSIGVKAETIPIRKKNIYSYIKLIIKTIFIREDYNISWEWFDRKIKWSKYIPQSNKNISQKYDYFIAGSDQIWNYKFECNSQREFLPFAKSNQKIAYAASIGLDELPKYIEQKYKVYLKSFNKISVREKSAADLVYNLTGNKVPVMLDPTMLLTAEQWKNIVAKSNIMMNSKYIVKYFLGTKNILYDKYINDYAKKINADIIDITNPPENLKYKISPIEFVSLIMDCEAVFTDSFHSGVFSILFHKNFIIFERPYQEGYGKMSSRLDTLLELFSLKGRMIKNPSELEDFNIICDFSDVENVLVSKRKEAFIFFNNALNLGVCDSED